MEQQIVKLIRRWILFILIMAIGAGLATFSMVRSEPIVYQARARLIVGPGIDSLNPDLSALRAGGQLMQTYAELPKTTPFLEGVISDLKLDMGTEKVSRMIDVKANQETQILSIQVQNLNPDLAVRIANSVADNLVALSPSGQGSTAALMKEQMRSQALKTEQIITDTEASIKQLETELQDRTDPVRQRLIVDQLVQDRRSLSDSLNNLTVLYNKLQETNTNQVKIIEPAQSAQPVVSQSQLKVIVAGFAGLILGLAIALGFEYLDDSVKTEEELAQATGLPLLGSIARYRPLSKRGEELLVVKALPSSKTAENYRMLGTKLLPKYKLRQTGPQNTSEDKTNGKVARKGGRGNSFHEAILISGIQENSECSEIAANLAVVMSQAGFSVTLMDANLRQPAIEGLFKIHASTSLADLLDDQDLNPKDSLVQCGPNLSILPSDVQNNHPFELLATPEMTRLIEKLKGEVNVMIIAAPPLLSAAESLVLASQVDSVILAARAGESRRAALADAVQSLGSLNANIVGAVLDYNQSPRLILILKNTLHYFRSLIQSIVSPGKIWLEHKAARRLSDRIEP